MNFELTDREKEIYKLLATTDLSTKQIGKMLYLTMATVETHKTNIFQKLNISRRTQLVRHYYEGLLKNGNEN